MTVNEMAAANAECERRLGDSLSCFNPDGTENRQRIPIAIDVITFATMQGWESGVIGINWFRRGHDYPDGDYLYIWDNRDGQPWQADIEAHCAAWRAAPRPFCTDIALCMEVLWPRLRAALKNGCLERFDIYISEVVNGGDYDGFYIEANTGECFGGGETILEMGEVKPTLSLAIVAAFRAVTKEATDE